MGVGSLNNGTSGFWYNSVPTIIKWYVACETVLRHSFNV